ncbi:choice-of-anchor A family protein [Kitasatospora sp. NBC_01246]
MGSPERRTAADRRPSAVRGRGAVRLAVATAVAALPMAAVLTVGSAAPLAPPLGACSGPDCPAVWPTPPHNGDFAGRDATINVFTGGDYTVNGRAAEVEGKIVTLGDLTVDKSQGGGAFNMGVVGVGSRVVPPNGSDFVTVGGAVDVKAGNRILIGGSDSKGAAFGNLRHAGTVTGTVDIDPTGRSIADPDAAAPYRSVLNQIEEVSACVARATATGTVTVTGSEATFAGDGTSMKQVFNVTGNLGSATRQIGLVFTGVPAGATVVVNMLAADPVINTYTGTGLPGDQTTEMRSRLMWNFPTATDARILGGAQFQGSVMAGNAGGTTTLAQPGMNGRVYLAGNLIQTGNGGYEIHGYPFDGDLPDCAVTPSPSPTSPSPSPTSPSPTPTSTSPSPTSASPSPTSASPSPASPTSTSSTPAPTSSSPAPTGPSEHPTSHRPSSHRPTSHLPAPGSSTGGGGQLPSTGAGDGPVVLGLAGVAVLGLGGLAVLVARRRGRHS